MKQKAKPLVALLFCFVLYSCKHSNRAVDYDVVVTETFHQHQVLPVMAMIDLSADSTSTKQYLSLVKRLLNRSPDSVSMNMNSYLTYSRENPLFKRFRPNVSKKGKLFKDTSILGYANNADTAMVSHILTDSGMLQYGMELKWISDGTGYERKRTNKPYFQYSALVAKHAQHKMVVLDSTMIENIEVIRAAQSWYYRLLAFAKGEEAMVAKVQLSKQGLLAIKENFSPGAQLLIECFDCTGEDRHYFKSTVQQNVEQGLILPTSSVF